MEDHDRSSTPLPDIIDITVIYLYITSQDITKKNPDHGTRK